MGVLKPRASDLYKFEPRIVSAEIKVVADQSIVAFGQAISYKLFSHKSYLVLPDTLADEDRDRVERLATVVGLGLVIFSLDASDPRFRLVTRANATTPDMFYVNLMASRLRETDRRAYDRLF